MSTTRSTTALLLAALLLGVPARAADQGGRIVWSPRHDELEPGPSESMVPAALPEGIEIARAPVMLRPEKAAYLGRWRGYMCRGKSFDIRLAVIQVDGVSARLVYAGASLTMTPHVERVTARFVGTALVAGLKDERQITLGLRKDGHMNVRGEKRNWPGHWCIGLLSRE
jgi:hypothetical protein